MHSTIFKATNTVIKHKVKDHKEKIKSAQIKWGNLSA